MGINYIRAHMSRAAGDARHDIRVYMTVNDYHAYHFYLESYEGSVNMSQDMAIMNVVNHTVFDGLERGQTESGSSEMTSSDEDVDDEASTDSIPIRSLLRSPEVGIIEHGVIGACTALILSVMVLAFRKIFGLSKKNSIESQESGSQEALNTDDNSDTTYTQDQYDRKRDWEWKNNDPEKTVLLAEDDSRTVAISNGIIVTLTDIGHPDHVYRHEVREPIVVGRSKTADICIPNDAGISRQHFKLFVRDGGLYLHDLGSVNPTIVNGNAVGDADVLISDGDELYVGNTGLRVSLE